ncbi:hypothetical protein V8J82_04550 [Gymnodinialimonas sp. 2305UL16-5]|uniref:hypothetical protein n=1 Tax=Gymnodinialimonas mytili TaxID=3126503 RepID=UPI0030B0F853
MFHPRILTPTLAALAICVPMAAVAQSNLDRFEALSEQMTALTYQGLVEQVPALEGQLPSVEWDRPMRRAGRCALRAYERSVGEDGVTAMLNELERAIATASPSDILTGSFEAGVPAGLTANEVQTINNDCGMVELQMQRLAESGAMQALQGQ